MQSDRQAVVSNAVWAVMAVLLLACLVMAVMLWQKRSPPSPEQLRQQAREQQLAQWHANVRKAVLDADRHARNVARQRQREEERQLMRQGAAAAPAAAAPVDAVPVASQQAPVAGVPAEVRDGPPVLMPMPAAPVEPVLHGADGLASLVRSGVLRRAAPYDLQRWVERARVQRAGGLSAEALRRLEHMPAYVISGAMRVPDGLAGANAVVFLINAQAPHPMGSLGHSLLLDTDTGGCTGVTCGIFLQ